MGWVPCTRAFRDPQTCCMISHQVSGAVAVFGKHDIRNLVSSGEKLVIRGPHDQHINESLTAYSTPSPWSQIGIVLFFQFLLLQGWSCSLGSFVFSTSVQNCSTFSSGKISWKLSSLDSSLNIMCGRKIDPNTFSFFKDFGSMQVTSRSIGSGTHTFFTNLHTRSLCMFPGTLP